MIAFLTCQTASLTQYEQIELKIRNEPRIATAIYAIHHTPVENNKFKKLERPINNDDTTLDNLIYQYERENWNHVLITLLCIKARGKQSHQVIKQGNHILSSLNIRLKCR